MASPHETELDTAGAETRLDTAGAETRLVFWLKIIRHMNNVASAPTVTGSVYNRRLGLIYFFS